MCALVFAGLAAFAVAFIGQPADAASSQQQHARSLGQCVKMANARGWSRPGEKGRLPFIRRCMQGQPV